MMGDEFSLTFIEEQVFLTGVKEIQVLGGSERMERRSLSDFRQNAL